MNIDRLGAYLEEMQQAAVETRDFVGGMNKDAFLNDLIRQRAVAMNLLMIGEATSRVMDEYPEFAARFDSVPWQKMRGMRNRIAHGYMNINLDTVWDTVQTAVPALKAAQDLAPLGIDAAVVNARFVKPLDKELLRQLLGRIPNLITVEDHATAGGFGSAILEFLADEGLSGIRVKRLGVSDRFIPHGTQDELRKICGFDKDAITQATLQFIRRGKKRNREGWERGSA